MMAVICFSRENVLNAGMRLLELWNTTERFHEPISERIRFRLLIVNQQKKELLLFL
jgi:hypothetical protein